MNVESSPQRPALAPLMRLEGTWELEAVVNGAAVGGGWTRFEWINDGAFLYQTVDRYAPPDDAPPEWTENSPEPVHSIIGLDDSSGQFTMLYADARNVFRAYQMTFEGDTWRIWRNAPGFCQRFTGTFSTDGNTISGAWEFSPDGEAWSVDFELIYRRAQEGN